MVLHGRGNRKTQGKSPTLEWRYIIDLDVKPLLNSNIQQLENVFKHTGLVAIGNAFGNHQKQINNSLRLCFNLLSFSIKFMLFKHFLIHFPRSFNCCLLGMKKYCVFSLYAAHC